MKATTVKKLFFLLLTVIILVPILNSLNYTDENRSVIINDQGIYSTKAVSPKPKLSADEFQLTQEFTPSTYFISPDSSPGDKDEVFFSFATNRDGNYTLDIGNSPIPLTENEIVEHHPSFDNPNSSSLYYLSYRECGVPDDGSFNIKLMTSKDRGQNWDVETVASYKTEESNVATVENYVLGTGIAANPSEGVIGIITYFNQSELLYIGSVDNGTTWSVTERIANVSTIGCESLFIDQDDFPFIELGILPNGTIYALTETESNSYTDIVYLKSNDNGTTWVGPYNITCLEGLEVYKPKLQVDLETGDHWLAFKEVGGDVSWAEFNLTDSLSSASVSTKLISDIGDNNYDFIYDKNAGIFRMTEVGQWKKLNYTTPDFETAWINNALEIPEDLIQYNYQESSHLNIVHDGDNLQFFYKDWFFGQYDIIKYTYFENATFWRKKGNFNEGEFIQIKWDGEFSNPIPINMTRVKVDFVAANGTQLIDPEPIKRGIYLTIDDNPPSFESFNQNLNYFNPVATNISFSEILWDMLPSEPCYVNLEVFTENSSISDSLQVTNNLWYDGKQKIFLSNTGLLYILYETVVSGRYFVYLRRSLDNGITWSEPIEVFQDESSPAGFCGAAWNDIVIVLVDGWSGGQYLYRSYDQGATWQDVSNFFQLGIGYSVDVSFVYNSTLDTLTLYVALYNYSGLTPDAYFVVESTDLGFNWKISGEWYKSGEFFGDIEGQKPKFIYDYPNGFLHLMISSINTTDRMLNINFLTLLAQTWVQRYNGPEAQAATEETVPYLLVTRETPSDPTILRAIYSYETIITQGELITVYWEFNSTDNGVSWNGPYKSSIVNGTGLTFTSVFDYDTVYYLQQKSDGSDQELFLFRDGRLVKSKRAIITPNNITEFTFNGIDDFGSYIDEGNYSYTISFEDPSGNRVEVNGWLYADYNAPQISDHSTNWNIPPTPRYDVAVTVKITELNNFTAYLYYRKDGGNWQKILMRNTSIEDFSATIPGDTQTLKTEYYIQAVDLAGNEFILDDNGDYFICDMPTYIWDSEGLFKETKSYSSSRIYELSVTILNDLSYVKKVLFRYSYDEGDEWDDLELEQSSPEFEGELDDIPEDLKELYYKIVIVDIFGIETELTDTKKVEFYPEVPSLELNPTGMVIAGVISATMGILIAIGYTKLKKTSHETIHKQMLYKKYKKTPDDVDKTFIKKDLASYVEGAKEFKIAAEFTSTYLGILFSTIALLIIGSLISGILSLMAIYLIVGSLIMAVFGYTILMSRDIKLNIYKEKIIKKNIFFEGIQMALMFIIIVSMILVFNSIPWFRYYLIESTFDIGIATIPTLYISVITVFFTSLILVVFSTYLQLNKTVNNVQKQRKEGETENFLLFTKDQSSSKLISQLTFKTIAFLAAVLISIITTANLMTYDTVIVLIVVIIPFIIACASILLLHYVLAKFAEKAKITDIEVPFVGLEKICIKCGKSTYLSDKFCGICGAQLILPEKFGIYVAKCKKCDALINNKANHCPTCGTRI